MYYVLYEEIQAFILRILDDLYHYEIENKSYNIIIHIMNNLDRYIYQIDEYFETK